MIPRAVLPHDKIDDGGMAGVSSTRPDSGSIPQRFGPKAETLAPTTRGAA